MSMVETYYERERQSVFSQQEEDEYYRMLADQQEAEAQGEDETEPVLDAIREAQFEARRIQRDFDDAENQRPVWEWNCDNPYEIESRYLNIYAHNYYPHPNGTPVHLDWH